MARYSLGDGYSQQQSSSGHVIQEFSYCFSLYLSQPLLPHPSAFYSLFLPMIHSQSHFHSPISSIYALAPILFIGLHLALWEASSLAGTTPLGPDHVFQMGHQLSWKPPHACPASGWSLRLQTSSCPPQLSFKPGAWQLLRELHDSKLTFRLYRLESSDTLKTITIYASISFLELVHTLLHSSFLPLGTHTARILVIKLQLVCLTSMTLMAACMSQHARRIVWKALRTFANLFAWM